MRVRRSTFAEVKARLQQRIDRKLNPAVTVDPLERIEQRKIELEEKRLKRIEQRQKEKLALKANQDDSEMAQFMGFGGFGSSKAK
jgi:hypothetical protein